MLLSGNLQKNKMKVKCKNCIIIFVVTANCRFAEVHNRLDLLETALRFIEANFPQVCQEEEFLDLPKEHLVQFLSSDYIHIDTECQVGYSSRN